MLLFFPGGISVAESRHLKDLCKTGDSHLVIKKLMNRRKFIQNIGLTSAGLVALGSSARAQTNQNSKLRVLVVGVIGTIGGTDRREVAKHPMAEITGLCDVDSNALAKSKQDHPEAFTCADYREAFAQHSDKFDAVIVATPDHTHAPILLTAMANDKHVYAQKPLVQQLNELSLVENAMAAKPSLCTQLGNQRIGTPGRQAAVALLQSQFLGKVRSVHTWVDSPNSRTYFNLDKELKQPTKPPQHLDWNLWLGPSPQVPYRDGICPIVWRSLWDFGTNAIGDWGCHVLDVLFMAFDELKSPMAVQTHCPAIDVPEFHVHPCHSTITYAVDSPKFAAKHLPIFFNDSGRAPSPAAFGLANASWPSKNMAVIECEGGLMALTAGGKLDIWRDGKQVDGLTLPNMDEFKGRNHWHDWVDHCLGKNQQAVAPLDLGARLTEPALLAVKASKFPGIELRWDRSQLRFTNNEEATELLVRRKDERSEFAPPEIS